MLLENSREKKQAHTHADCEVLPVQEDISHYCPLEAPTISCIKYYKDHTHTQRMV